MILAAPHGRAETVRMGLFGLFKPQVVEARVVSGDGVAMDLNRLTGSRQLSAGSRVRLQLVGEQLQITISDARGGIRQTFNAAEARLRAGSEATLELTLPGKLRRTVRGDLIVTAGDKSLRGALKIVLTTEREAAVASIVAAETEARAPEALKALAIVVRTYMLSHTGRHAADGFDFCDTTHCQLYRGESDLAAEAARPVVLSAVAATAGEHLSFAGEPVETYFSASCGGWTATPRMVWGGACAYPYRRQRCQWCRASSHYRWARQIDARAIINALAAAIGAPLSPSTEVAVDGDDAGFVRGVSIRDSGRGWTMSGDEFRRATGRRLGWNVVLSGSFTVTRRGAQMIFSGRGFGSQVGLCLAGAVAQARSGRRYEEILRFYFPQAQVSRRSQTE